MKTEHAETKACECAVCRRMVTEDGQAISNKAKGLANEFGMVISANVHHIMDVMNDVEYGEARVIFSEAAIPLFTSIVNTVMAEAFFDNAEAPAKEALTATLRRSIEAKLHVAVDLALENDRINRAARDGATVIGNDTVN